MADASTHLPDDAAKLENAEVSTPNWDMSQERAFIENLVGQRTNFLLVFFAMVIAGGLNAGKVPVIQLSILLFGTVVVFLLTLAVGRSQKKLDLILDILKECPAHPVSVIDSLAGPEGSKRKIIGYGLPWLCTIALVVASVASWLGCLL